MGANAIQSTYDLSYGIQDIIQNETGSLPQRASVAPSDAASISSLSGVYAARNCAAAVNAFLRPEVQNLENISPYAHKQALHSCMDQLSTSDAPAAKALCDLLQSDRDNTRLLETFQGLLVEG